MKKKIKIEKNKGAAMMVVVLFFMFISLTILIGIVTPVVREFKIASDNFSSKKAYFLAESGVEDILYRLKNNKQTSGENTLILGNSIATTSVTDITNDKKEIISLGNTDSIQRRVKIMANTGFGASFSYGVLSGVGGFSMDNNSKIIGSVYSNGTITGSGSITGSATSANSPALASDQSNGTGLPDYSVSFGNTNGAQDFAQSFQVNTTGVASKVQVYLKKISTPSNITVRLVTDLNGSPSSNTLTSATLSASAVPVNYDWVDISFPNSIQLSAGVKYWLVLDTVTSSTKYYLIGANNNGYLNGLGKIGQYSSTWNNTSPTDLDSFFNLYLGGVTGLISGVTIGTGSIGNAYAHTVNDATIGGLNFCKTGSGNNKTCDPSKSDPIQKSMPISERSIQAWKEVAEKGGVTIGNYTVPASMDLGSQKITGNLNILNGKTLTLGGVIWVQGNLIIENNCLVKLNSSFGNSSEVIIVDGTITISNNAKFGGSGADGSYVLVISTSSSTSAISLANNAGAVALYAANGTINVANNGGAKSINGYSIHLAPNVVIEYDSGLTDLNFVSGPSGSWNIDSWQETQ